MVFNEKLRMDKKCTTYEFRAAPQFFCLPPFLSVFVVSSTIFIYLFHTFFVLFCFPPNDKKKLSVGKALI